MMQNGYSAVRRTRDALLCTLLGAVLSGSALADTVTLSSGEILTGQVVEVTQTSVHLSQQGKLLVLPRTAARSIQFSSTSSQSKAGVAQALTLPPGQTLRLEVLGWSRAAAADGKPRVQVSFQTAAEIPLAKAASIPVGSWVTATLHAAPESANSWTLALDSIVAPQRQYPLTPTRLSQPKVIRGGVPPKESSSVAFDHSTPGNSEGEGPPVAGATWLRRGNLLEATVVAVR